MKFFEAQKRASFAAKLFATVGFDFDAALAASNENALKAHVGSADAYAALFAAAGIDPKALLAAGPDALKLHIEGLDDSAAAAQLTTDLTAANAKIGSLNERLAAFGACFEAVGFGEGAKIEAKDFTAKFNARISTRARELVAATGGPILEEAPAADATAPTGKKTLNRAGFNQLAPSAQADFCALIREGKAVLTD